MPKELREAYRVNVGDEAVVIARGNELTMYLHNVSKNPLQDLVELSKTVSIGLSAEELKKKVDEERLKQFLETS
ncbi:MAG: hypothetical protein QXN62_05815 [Candidatus Bathyarchaeia archaeon]|nr:hypothetical protein [Candidatus Bathyarchaeota archaeon]